MPYLLPRSVLLAISSQRLRGCRGVGLVTNGQRREPRVQPKTERADRSRERSEDRGEECADERARDQRAHTRQGLIVPLEGGYAEVSEHPENGEQRNASEK